MGLIGHAAGNHLATLWLVGLSGVVAHGYSMPPDFTASLSASTTIRTAGGFAPSYGITMAGSTGVQLRALLRSASTGVVPILSNPRWIATVLPDQRTARIDPLDRRIAFVDPTTRRG